MKIKKSFTNLNDGPMILSVPAWQTEVVKQISEDYHDAAVERNQAFRKAVDEIVSNPDAIYSGPAVLRIIRETPKLDYIKNYTAPDGETYDIEIDILAMTVSFRKI